MDDGQGPEEPETAPAAVDGEPKASHLSVAGGNALERAKAEEELEDPNDPQMHFFSPDGKWDLSKIEKMKVPITYEMAIEGRAIPNIKGGLLDPNVTVPLFAEAVVGDYKPTFIRDENRKVESVKMKVTLKPFIAQSIETEAGQTLLAESLKGKTIYPALLRVLTEAAA